MEKYKTIIEWFGNIKDKEIRHIFISFDIVDFYPSISEKPLDQALSWASNLATISDNDISIIKHARKSLLFNTGKPWTKKDSEGLFDVRSVASLKIYSCYVQFEALSLFIF